MSAKNNRSYDAVVFDLLTALLDSWTLWNKVAGSPKGGLEWRRKYLELTYEAVLYRPYEDLIAEAAEQVGVAVEKAAQLTRRWSELTPWPEAPKVLKELDSRVLLGIATNSSNRLAEIAAAASGGHFSAMVTAEAVGFYKPQPQVYRRVLEELGTEPQRTLFVAGSAADVPGAAGVGMPVYWHNRAGLPMIGEIRPLWIEKTLIPLLEIV